MLLEHFCSKEHSFIYMPALSPPLWSISKCSRSISKCSKVGVTKLAYIYCTAAPLYYIYASFVTPTLEHFEMLPEHQECSGSIRMFKSCGWVVSGWVVSGWVAFKILETVTNLNSPWFWPYKYIV